MKKSRDYVNSSALGSYFGVGFNTPNEQIEIDLGNVIPEFDDAAKERMMLGNVLEDSVIDFFEKKLNITITDRNDKMLTFHDGRMKGKLDGMTALKGKRTVVEIKVSNSTMGPFTENMGYLLQVQAYMYATGTEQALLCGLYKGKPLMKIIKRDEEIIEDIKEMADFIHEVLIGLEDFNNYPTHILEKYSRVTILDDFDEVTAKDEEDFTELLTLKEKKKTLDGQIKEIENRIKANFEPGKFENDYLNLSLSQNSRKGGLDEANLELHLASQGIDINLNDFRKPGSSYKVIRIKGRT